MNNTEEKNIIQNGRLEHYTFYAEESIDGFVSDCRQSHTQ